MNNCEYISKCLYGSKVFKGDEQIIRIYKNLFCEAGDSKIKSCKRYQIIRMAGYCPSNVLPNSMLSMEKIMDKMKLESKMKFIRT